MDKIVLTQKELTALDWLSRQSELEAVEVSHFRDDAGIGWLRVGIIPKLSYSGGRKANKKEFKVSPLGHVYAFPAGEILASYDTIKRSLKVMETF